LKNKFVRCEGEGVGATMEGASEKPSNQPGTRTGGLALTPADRAAALRRVKAPALGLMLVGLINAAIAMEVIECGFFTHRHNLGVQEGAIGVIFFLGALVVVVGGLSLRRLGSYGLARTGSIAAMVPCLSPCVILAVPIGVWALVTTSNPDVRRAFPSRAK
jgi:hypothetical protein